MSSSLRTHTQKYCTPKQRERRRSVTVQKESHTTYYVIVERDREPVWFIATQPTIYRARRKKGAGRRGPTDTLVVALHGSALQRWHSRLCGADNASIDGFYSAPCAAYDPPYPSPEGHGALLGIGASPCNPDVRWNRCHPFCQLSGNFRWFRRDPLADGIGSWEPLASGWARLWDRASDNQACLIQMRRTAGRSGRNSQNGGVRRRHAVSTRGGRLPGSINVL